MSEPTKENIIDGLDTMLLRACADCEEHEPHQIAEEIKQQMRQSYRAARHLIETRPRVTKEFVEKWSGKIYDLIPEEDSPMLDDGEYPGSDDPIRERLIAMLCELGHEVEEKEA